MAVKTPKEELIILPKTVLDNLKTASAEELKILIHTFAYPDCSISDAARDLGMTALQAEKAVSFWRGAGIFVEADAPVKKVARDTSAYRNYDKATIADTLNNSADFRMINQIALENLGKTVLTSNDLSSLLYLYDFAGIPAPVICGIIADCCANEKKNMQYIFKKALALYEEGIDSYDKLEEYFARRKAINSNIGKLRKLFGMGDRALTANEKKMFDCWFGEWNMPFELVKLAYEKNIDGIGKLSPKYMNTILRRWFESGFTTVEDVNKGEASRETGMQSSFDDDEFIAAALKRGFDD